MKNLTKYFLNNKAFSWLILCLFLIGGVLSYVQMLYMKLCLRIR